MNRHGVRAAAAAWIVAWLITAALIAVTKFSSRDPDSQLYAGISARLAQEPVSRWIAPQWWGFWHIDGPYVEHPFGMFVVPALLGRAGYPPDQSAYAINALYQILSFALVTSIAAAVTTAGEARALGSILQILPIAFVFRIRANQEYAVLAGVLFALYATERARHDRRWIAGMLAGFCAVLLVKGVFAVIVPVVCAVWLIAMWASGGSRRARDIPPWIAVAMMPMVAVVVAWLYDSAYAHVTGQSFLALYQSRQLPEEALTGQSPLHRTAYNLSWYLTRVGWYPFPWSLLALLVAAASVRARQWWPWRVPGDPGDGTDRGRRAVWFAFVAALALTFAFSLAHRKADRYIFPAYFLIAAAGAGPALRRFPRLARIATRLDRPWTPAVAYVVLFLLTLLSVGHLPRITFWRT